MCAEAESSRSGELFEGQVNFSFSADVFRTLAELYARMWVAKSHVPPYKILHYCFSRVIGMPRLLRLVFFTVLYEDSNYEYTTYLSREEIGKTTSYRLIRIQCLGIYAVH